jgi:integral membrane protein
VLGLGAIGIAWILWHIPTRAEPHLEPLAPAGRWYRVAAIAEAATWLGLLIGMAVKYAGSGSEDGVAVFGPIHGVVVLGYVAVTFVAARALRWGGRTLALALLASVPPFGTVLFEEWATRSGRLAAPAHRVHPAVRG